MEKQQLYATLLHFSTDSSQKTEEKFMKDRLLAPVSFFLATFFGLFGLAWTQPKVEAVAA
jgi:hypothetical protein